MKTTSSITLTLSITMMVISPSWGLKEFATQATSQLEKLYMDDCNLDSDPHGFYGAFLQPCEFQFRRSKGLASAYDDVDACSDEKSTLISSPRPMHWFFNLSEHYTKEDWEKLSSNDMPTAEDLMLWPDQCVGIKPRCYSTSESSPAIQDTLARLFSSGGIPQDATHVIVDCRGDAAALSRVVYAMAGGLETSAPTLMAWMVTVLLVSTVMGMWCIYACLRLCGCNNGDGSRRPNYYNKKAAIPNYDFVETVDCEVVEGGSNRKELKY